MDETIDRVIYIYRNKESRDKNEHEGEGRYVCLCDRGYKGMKRERKKGGILWSSAHTYTHIVIV